MAELLSLRENTPGRTGMCIREEMTSLNQAKFLVFMAHLDGNGLEKADQSKDWMQVGSYNYLWLPVSSTLGWPIKKYISPVCL